MDQNSGLRSEQQHSVGSELRMDQIRARNGSWKIGRELGSKLGKLPVSPLGSEHDSELGTELG